MAALLPFINGKKKAFINGEEQAFINGLFWPFINGCTVYKRRRFGVCKPPLLPRQNISACADCRVLGQSLVNEDNFERDRLPKNLVNYFFGVKYR